MRLTAGAASAFSDLFLLSALPISRDDASANNTVRDQKQYLNNHILEIITYSSEQ